MNAQTQNIIALIAAATEGFTTCDWTMDLNEEELAEYTAKVEAAAKTAAEYGAEAVEAIDGDIDDVAHAVHLLSDAVELEKEFGDSPAWGPALKAAEALYEDMRAAASEEF